MSTRPFTLLVKPAGPDCNIDCDYCFYSCKTDLFGEKTHRMSVKTLEKMIKNYLEIGLPVSGFAFQGGEPMLMGLDFYKQVVEFQKQYGRSGQAVSNALQTNGTLLDDEWCEFLREYKWLVGVSVDGPKIFHDHYRKNFAGEGTFDKVMQGIKTLKRNRVEFNTLTLLNDRNVKAADDLFDFFLENNFRYLQFIPCVEQDHATGEIADFAVKPGEFGDFLCRIFERWYENGPEKVSIRIIDSLLSRIVQGNHTNCTFSYKCNDYLVVEHNGDVFCCDFFVDEEHKVGNIHESHIGDLIDCGMKREFAEEKTKLSNKCLICRYRDICRGGCLKDKIKVDGSDGSLSYLCPAYKQFFDHAIPRLTNLAAMITSR